MATQHTDLETARQTYDARLDILRQSRILYQKNKHRSVPNRGPYEYGLKVAQEEFEAAKAVLQSMLENTRQSGNLAKTDNAASDTKSPAATVAKKRNVAAATQKPKRVFLAKLQQAEALRKELALH